jgi:hypothetical protein
MGQVVGLHWWQPEAKGPLYLAITMQKDENVSGDINPAKRLETTLYRLIQDQPQIVQSQIANMVGSFDLDGDGRPETLLGQDLDRDITFGTRIWQYRPSGDGVTSTKTEMSLPLGFPVISGAVCRLGGTEWPTPIWIKSRALYIARKGKSPYEVSGNMGDRWPCSLMTSTPPIRLAECLERFRSKLLLSARTSMAMANWR